MEHTPATLDVSIAQLSDKGKKSENQDTIGARIPEGQALKMKGIAIATADGVSSSNAAKLASQTVVCGLLTDYYATPDTWRTTQSVTQVLQSLNRYLWSQSQNNVQSEGQLTTLSMLILKGDKAFVFHVGDSRIYRLRDGVLEQLTRDHNQRMSATKTYLSRAVGADSRLEIDNLSEQLSQGDRYILTTDGIHDALGHSDFTALVQDTTTHPDDLCQAIHNAALDAGSQDNLSIQIVDVNTIGTSDQADAIDVLSSLPFPPFLKVGEIIDGLTVEKILHESERSQVYLVKTPEDTRLVMKTPSVNYVDDSAYIERFILEGWIGARIHHPNVIKVVTPKTAPTFLYYLTEYINAPTLGQIITQRAPLNVIDAVEIIEQVIKAARGLHRKDTLHQDIKPDNILLSQKGAMLIDFGACYVAGIHEVGHHLEHQEILGTATYTAPEYRYGGTIGMHSEQFSIAVIMYELLTGKHPYGNKFEQAKSYDDFKKLTYLPAHSVNPLVPVWLDRALEKALSIKTDHRYDRLSQWLVDLQRPNPAWLTRTNSPLIEKNPYLVWQCLAALGWGVAITLALLLAGKN